MKRIILSIFLIVLLIIPFVSASIFDWITGRVTEGTEQVKEEVKCVFLNSNSEQKCFTDDSRFSCSGIGSCVIGVSGQQGQQLHWKNLCGSEAYTKIDGVDDSLEFKCEPIAIPPPTSTETVTVPAGAVYEEVTCDFAYSNAIQQCYSEDKKFSCTGKDRCLAKIYGKKGERIIFKGTCKEGYSEILIDGVYQNVWFNCEGTVPTTQSTTTTEPVTPTVVVPTTPTPVPSTTLYPITEQVKCSFIDPDPMLKHSCGTSGGSCTWIWDGIKTEARDERMRPLLEKEINGEKVKYASCTAEVIGENGEKKTWRSTCGGEADTIMDGTNEEVEFRCLSDRQVNIEQISGKGFRYAFWWCQGGAGASPPSLGSEEVCKTADAWKKLAEEYCTSSCHRDVSGKEKCGLYSFSVSKECYFATEAERKAAQEMPITGEQLKMREASAPRMMASIMIYSYLGECPECAELEKGGDDSHDNLPIMLQDRAKITDFRYANFNYKSFLDKYPNEHVLLYMNIMAEMGDPVKAYAKVYEKPGKANFYSTSEWFDMINSRTIHPVFDSFSDKVETRQEEIDESLVYYYIGECPECQELDKLKDRFGMILHKENKEKMALPLAIHLSTLEGFLKEYQNEPILLLARFRGDSANDLLIYARGGKADYDSATKWIKDISRGKVEIAAIVSGIKETPVLKQGAFEEEKKAEKIKEEKTEKTASAAKEGDILICKDSCPLDGKCYPFGYRKGGEYCSDEGMFKEQSKEDAICENNFECSTNVCVDGKCISSGLIQKIANWFKKLFGRVDREEAKEKVEIVDCGASSECMENAFKVCKPAKISQSGSMSEIIGLKDGKCVLKMTVGTESMTCKIKNYALGTKNLGNMEQYCEGALVKKLGSFTTASKIQSPVAEEAISKEVEVPAQTETLNAISACKKIRETGLKYKCTAMVKKDSSDCEMVDEPATAYCYADVALVTQDSAICEKIKDLGHRGACEALVERVPAKCSEWIYADYCYRDVAALIGDTSICDQIKYEGGKMTCKAVILKDVSLCQNTDTEDCYQKIALLTGDEKACDELSKIQITGERPIAIHNLDEEVSKCIKMAKKEITGCSPESGSGTDCDLIPAMAKNPSLCEKLEVTYFPKDGCYFYAAMRTADLLPPQLIVLRN